MIPSMGCLWSEEKIEREPSQGKMLDESNLVGLLDELEKALKCAKLADLGRKGARITMLIWVKQHAEEAAKLAAKIAEDTRDEADAKKQGGLF